MVYVYLPSFFKEKNYLITTDRQKSDSFYKTFKDFTTKLEGSNILKLYTVEVCFYQTFFPLEEKKFNDSFWVFKTIVFDLFLPYIFT